MVVVWLFFLFLVTIYRVVILYFSCYINTKFRTILCELFKKKELPARRRVARGQDTSGPVAGGFCCHYYIIGGKSGIV